MAATQAASVEPASVYAGFSRRFSGWLLDYVIFVVLGGIVIAALSLLLENAASLFNASTVDYLFENRRLLVVTLALVLGWLYFAGLESSRLQGTPGQRIMGIKVTNTAGAHVPLWRASLRLVAKLLSASFFMAGYLIALFSAKRQTLHDLIAGCVVVRTTASPEAILAAGGAPRASSVLRILALVVVVPSVLALVAAMVIPEYNNYVDRSRVSAAAQTALKVQAALGLYYTKNRQLPNDLDAAGAAGVISPQIQRMTLYPGTGELQVVLAGPRVQGKTIRLVARSNGHDLYWACFAEDLPPRIKSAACDASNKAIHEKFLK